MSECGAVRVLEPGTSTIPRTLQKHASISAIVRAYPGFEGVCYVHLHSLDLKTGYVRSSRYQDAVKLQTQRLGAKPRVL
jgi:hypothetical protein